MMPPNNFPPPMTQSQMMQMPGPPRIAPPVLQPEEFPKDFNPGFTAANDPANQYRRPSFQPPGPVPSRADGNNFKNN